MELVPRERWTRTTDLIIFHGRKVCDARRPACGACPLFTLCGWESRQAWASARAAEGRAPPARQRRAGRRSRRRPSAQEKERPVSSRPPSSR